MHIAQKFKTSIAWNAFESIFYQLLLCCHQLMLYRSISTQTYGYVGTIFALSYLGATVLLLGFESAITPFFNLATTNKTYFRQLIVWPFIKQLVLMVVLGISFIYIHYYVTTLPFTHFSSSLLAMIFCIACCEGIRKFMRTLLQLMFQVKIIAFVELLMLLMYLVMVWGGYVYGCALTTSLIFIPLLITSLIANCFYGFKLIWYYQKLPATKRDIQLPPIPMLRNRMVNAFNTLEHIVCSGNFLVPLFASLAGFEIAAMFKLISYWCYSITPIIQRIFGLSSQALFASIKEQSLAEKMSMISLLNSYLFTLLSIIFFGVIGTATMVSFSGLSLMSHTHWIMIICFVVLLLSENIIVVYEKFCIAEEKVSHLLLYQLCTFTTWFLCARFFGYCATLLLGSLLITRLCSFALLIALTHKTLESMVNTIGVKVTSLLPRKTI